MLRCVSRSFVSCKRWYAANHRRVPLQACSAFFSFVAVSPRRERHREIRWRTDPIGRAGEVPAATDNISDGAAIRVPYYATRGALCHCRRHGAVHCRMSGPEEHGQARGTRAADAINVT